MHWEQIFFFWGGGGGGYVVGIFQHAKWFYQKIVSNQMHFPMFAFMLLMKFLEKMTVVFDWSGSIQLFFIFDSPGSDSIILQTFFTHQGIRIFRILLKFIYVLALSFSVHLYFSHDICCRNPYLTVVYPSVKKRIKFST